MAEKSFPLDNTEYSAEDAQLWFATRTSGVYAGTHLGVSADGTMNVTLGKGIAWLAYSEFGGCVYGNTDGLTLTVPMSNGTMNRIDRVCIRMEILNQKCYAYIKQGTAARSPSAPALQRDNVAYEISVAQIYVGTGVTSINAGNITDERLKSSVCGLMRDGVTGIDTSMLEAQLEESLGDLSADLEAFKEAEEASFNEWFESLQTQLEGDVAANLQSQVTVLDQNKLEGAAKTATLSTSGWSSGTQTVTVNGVTANSTVIVSPAAASFEAYCKAMVRCTAQAANSLTFTAKTTPTAALTVNVIIIEGVK